MSESEPNKTDSQRYQNMGAKDPDLPFNNINDNRIIGKSKLLLKSIDEFTNDKTEYMVKMFHSKIREQLKDPNKQFIVLTNENMNRNEFKCIFANNPDLKKRKFTMIPEDERQHLKATLNQSRLSDTPKIVPLKDATSNSYVTDEDTYVQHFPTEVLKYNTHNWWYSDIKEEKLLKIELAKLNRVKYIGINFRDPANIKQSFNVLYKTDKLDDKGEPILKMVAKGLTNFPDEGIQLVEFEKPILTDEIYLFITSDVAAINYVIAIENELSDKAIAMFSQTIK